MNDIYTLFTNALATETGVDAATANTIVTWLTTEGVLDNEILVETYAPVAGSFAGNDNTSFQTVA